MRKKLSEQIHHMKINLIKFYIQFYRNDQIKEYSICQEIENTIESEHEESDT